VKHVEAVGWSEDGNALRIIDQRELPERVIHRELREIDEVCEAITTLAVRGAPAIGIAAAIAMAVVACTTAGETAQAQLDAVADAGRRLKATRPTAPAGNLAETLRREAREIHREDSEMCASIGRHGSKLIPDGARIVTHCNAGALATGGTGTALAPIYAAVAEGRRVEVMVDETRPLLQGSRLTAWELSEVGIPVTIMSDGMAASMMYRERVDLCIVGADRVAANGDVANKIGTYALAIAARHHGVPFYVAAPSSTFDGSVPDGRSIPIEQRDSRELTMFAGKVVAPGGVSVWNPAFDVTPAAFISAIITDTGVYNAPYDFSRR
jgi:methylthioribose-1-phosphate isomerase